MVAFPAFISHETCIVFAARSLVRLSLVSRLSRLGGWIARVAYSAQCVHLGGHDKSDVRDKPQISGGFAYSSWCVCLYALILGLRNHPDMTSAS